jgi:hypothetical protein
MMELEIDQPKKSSLIMLELKCTSVKKIIYESYK